MRRERSGGCRSCRRVATDANRCDEPAKSQVDATVAIDERMTYCFRDFERIFVFEGLSIQPTSKLIVLSSFPVHVQQAHAQPERTVAVPAVRAMRPHHEELGDGDADPGSGQPAADVVQTAARRAGDQKGARPYGAAAVHPAGRVADPDEEHGRVGGGGGAG